MSSGKAARGELVFERRESSKRVIESDEINFERTIAPIFSSHAKCCKETSRLDIEPSGHLDMYVPEVNAVLVITQC